MGEQQSIIGALTQAMDVLCNIPPLVVGEMLDPGLEQDQHCHGERAQEQSHVL
jgi:hypothetical protein